jgi:hypothetical protein
MMELAYYQYLTQKYEQRIIDRNAGYAGLNLDEAKFVWRDFAKYLAQLFARYLAQCPVVPSSLIEKVGPGRYRKLAKRQSEPTSS